MRERMTSTTPTLRLIRLLRRLPRTKRFNRHLADCEAHEVLHQAEDHRVPYLTVRHVLRLDALPMPYKRDPPRAFDPYA